ncbi:hypothetical protein AVEN_178744-1 [Araneus ventricosus]|uniref:Uncharacterized protein n=1 Tax=Araneus ventricosus TaxID=182803 RepID=A0A4Y2I0J0_ARAVE|nr:hypothetical protein AVEN_178744-1 [Araneus ventricosus]
MAVEFHNRQTTILQKALPHQLHMVSIIVGRSPTMCIPEDILMSFGNLTAPTAYLLCLARSLNIADNGFLLELCFMHSKTSSQTHPFDRRKNKA